jgi:glutathione S-transferase
MSAACARCCTSSALVLVVQQNGKELPLFDSRIIAEFVLTHSPARPKTSDAEPPFHAVLFDPLHRYQDENMLTAIDAALDAAIAIFMFERDGLPRASAPYLKRQDARIGTCLKWVDETYGKRATLHTSGFSYLDLALITSLDWLAFRKVYDFSTHANLAYFYEQNRSRASIAATDPRIA